MNINLLDIVVLTKLAYTVENSISEYKAKNKNEEVLFCKVDNNIAFFHDIDSDATCIITHTKDLKKLIISVRGTDSLKDWTENLDIIKHYSPDKNSGIIFHSGFYDQMNGLCNFVYTQMESFKIEGGNEILFCGHSSGGAIASILCYSIAVNKKWIGSSKIATFGSPMFCNDAGVKWYLENTDKYYRCVNFLDPVPSVPALDKMGYCHIFKIILLFKNGNIISDTNAIKESKISWWQFLSDFIWHKINVGEHADNKYIEIVESHRILRNLNI